MVGGALSASAVTDAEMDQARAITAKYYLRYVNNGSDYLDKINPASMADLESKLKKTEQENIKKFKAAANPTGYGSWTKDQLIAYWSDTFFKEAKGLDPKGTADWIKNNAKNGIKANVKVGTPAAAAQPKAEETPAPASPKPEETAQASSPEVAQPAPQADVTENEAAGGVDGENAEDNGEQPEKKSSGTWVYIMILCILVAVVVALVVYASKTMKGQTAKSGRDDEGDDERSPYMPQQEERRSAAADEARIREKFAETLAAKSEEIRNLNRKLAEMENANAALKEENRRLKSELDNRRYQKPVVADKPQKEDKEYAAAPAPARSPRTIYLGRANARGLFVRADRHAVEGQSIFKLTTSDGMTGKFSVIDNPVVEEQILADPGRWAAGGCSAKDIFDTEGRERVVMEIPGMAVFQDGAWKVDKKARIRYE